MRSRVQIGVFVLLELLAAVAAHYSPQWAVHITGGPDVADRVAAQHGFINLGQIMPEYYHFQHRGVARRSLEPHDGHQARLDADWRVHWAQQQRVKSRQKRDLLPIALPLKGSRNQPIMINTDPSFNDQRWPQMWYLNRGEGLDMNVLPAWREGYTGKGVVVTILDDGLEKDHPDIVRNYDPLASYDVNNHDEDPMPRYDLIDSNRHGTRCAGEVAATANNSLCAVGVAYGAYVGGVRMLDGDVTDAVEARSLSLNPQHIDIYSASWGPDDDGKTVDGPGELATRAFMEGVTKGRGGKGSIFVWASGNGGRDHDNCNCDGYTNSIWTLSISSATEAGHVPWYSEACSSTLATTYSSGSLGEKQVVTTDLHHSCTSGHTGTSASAPLAAGICALALEANSELTWRDMQHIVVRTARPANLNAPDWQVNGVGRNVSHSFGYGLMDATAMVYLARTWKRVPEQHKCEISAPISDPTIPAKSTKKFSLMIKECIGVNYLEHVQAKISLTTLRRGDLEINLTSPAGTRSTLLAHRSHDISRQGFVSWPFMSVHTWGERPFGEWKLEIHNEGKTLSDLSNWTMILYGTTVLPGVNVKPDIQNNDLDVNLIDDGIKDSNFEINTIDSKWKEEHQVRDELSHVNIKQTDDIRSAACLQSSGNACLECEPSTYLHGGQCVTECPPQHFPFEIRPSERRANQLKPVIGASLLNPSKKKKKASSESKWICQSCHYSCYECSGISDYQCTRCYDDAVLVSISSAETYCFPASLTQQINYKVWYQRTVLLLIFILVVLLIFGFALIIKWLCNRRQSKNFYSSVSTNDVVVGVDLKSKLSHDAQDSDSE